MCYRVPPDRPSVLAKRQMLAVAPLADNNPANRTTSLESFTHACRSMTLICKLARPKTVIRVQGEWLVVSKHATMLDLAFGRYLNTSPTLFVIEPSAGVATPISTGRSPVTVPSPLHKFARVNVAIHQIFLARAFLLSSHEMANVFVATLVRVASITMELASVEMPSILCSVFPSKRSLALDSIMGPLAIIGLVLPHLNASSMSLAIPKVAAICRMLLHIRERAVSVFDAVAILSRVDLSRLPSLYATPMLLSSLDFAIVT